MLGGKTGECDSPFMVTAELVLSAKIPLSIFHGCWGEMILAFLTFNWKKMNSQVMS